VALNTAFEMHVPRAGAADVLEVYERLLPAPERGELQVTIEATGVAYADIVVRRGLYRGQKLPVTPGYDFVGRIEAIGPGVERFAVGQRVGGITVVGSYATRRNVSASLVVPAPENVRASVLAAVILNGVTAWQMFHRVARSVAGESVLVHGAGGGVGTLLLDFARLAKVRAIGVASGSKQDVVRARGGEPIDYESEDIAARARELSGGGVVAAFDHIGGRHLRSHSLAALRPGGTAVLYGGYDATRAGRAHPLAMVDLFLGAPFSAFTLFQRSIGIVGYAVPAWIEHRTQTYTEDLSRIFELVAAGELNPLVGATLPLRDAAAAHRMLEKRSIAGKIVLLNSTSE
jgi:NADPH:quinone reductase-like Zn-dependent oxidoreductase